MMTVYSVLGIMNGTSMDGVDLALLETDGESQIQAKAHWSIPYPTAIKEMLVRLVDSFDSLSASEYFQSEKTFMEFIAEAVREFLNKFKLENVDFLGIHGQTIRHYPEKRISIRLENGQRLASLLGIPVVGLLRENDLYHGGQGAPLVPIFHAALASKLGLQGTIVFVNIGGISNITLIDGDRICAFDCGLGNSLIDCWVQHKTGAAYDQNGELALAGKSATELLQFLMKDEYFLRKHPKSLDRAHFLHYLSALEHLSLEDGAATLTQFSAWAILKSLEQLGTMPDQMIVCGGGAKNLALLKYLADGLKCPVLTADDSLSSMGFTSQTIESQAFAYLAIRCVRKLQITFPETTGAPSNLSGGVIFQP